ncbi:hypothetical protein FOA52_015579 [Chlamydomonas sp. UWO 241]|nr:hypothetical protein FOA52_015579 [Chlamydomonas sp. UWO 241]
MGLRFVCQLVLCAACLRFSKGKLLILTVSLCLTTCFLSAWLDNVTTVLLMVPMTIEVFEVMKKDPIPLLIAQAILSNVGGCTTVIGDSATIIIGNQLRHYIGFIDFLIAMAPGVALVIPFALTTLILLHRSDLAGHVDNFEEVLAIVDQYTITEWALFYKCIYVTGAVIIGFLLQPIHGLAPAWIAVIGATVLILATEPKDVHAVLHAVEWDMLLFFAGMFIMVEAAAELGLIRRIVQFLQLVIDSAPAGSKQIAAIEAILWFSAIFSALLDNVPYVITMLPVIEQLAASRPNLDLRIMAWCLAFGACLGGNATMIGASANIVTVGLAAERGYKISFVYWLRTGVPTTIMAVSAANIYLIARYGFAGNNSPHHNETRSLLFRDHARFA